MTKNNSSRKQPNGTRVYPVTSTVLDDGTRVELVYDPEERRTGFAVFEKGQVRLAADCNSGRGERLVPYSPDNNLIKHGVVLLPSKPEEYGDEETLLKAIRAYIHRYVSVSDRFEQIAAYYVLLSWQYDRFNELPYLRLRGDYGSGKTRFLLTVGSLCYTPIFASGASTVSPLFHTLDVFRGTLIIDEADFRFSDEKAEIVKILNNGNMRGIPVLRTEVNQKHEYNPRAFHVFGPKLVATRGSYEDRALESRFITEEMSHQHLREDIPFSLPETYRQEALELRNKLLMYRLRAPIQPQVPPIVDPRIEPRLNQMFAPLLSIVEHEGCQEVLRELAREYHRDLIADRGMDIEAQVLQVIWHLMARDGSYVIPLRDIAAMFQEVYGAEYGREATSRWIGGILRRKLHLETYKSDGIYVLPLSERPKLDVLFERYGITRDEIAIGADKSDDVEIIFESSERS